jgi:DNA mismatch repair protein MutS
MVEMLETANILNNATGKSLIILDEIGRGTSTYDGVSIAWAVVEYIHDKIPGAKTLFATHFHELTELAETLKGFRNYHLSIKEWKDDIIFLYKVAEGSCDESFGIHVAKLAGVPGAVVSRAREILNNLQKDSMSGGITTKFINDRPGKEKQFELFAKNMEEDEVIAFLKNADVNNMTPVEALSKLLEIQKKLGGPRK